MHAVVRNGNYGVTMFFVISGYLITSNARRRWGYLGAIDARTFYVSRTARIMPCLLLLLVLVNGLAAVSVAIFSNHAPLGVAVSFWLVNFASLTFWIAWPIAQSHVFGVTGIALGTAVLLINAHASGAPGSARLLAPLRWSGKLSYELYLFHLVVLGGGLRTLYPPSAMHGNEKLLLLGVYLVLSAAVSTLIARGYATPLDRFVKRKWLRVSA